MSGNCTNGNYSIANRNCSGSDGNAYGGMHAIENAIAASGPTDTVLVRQFSGTYIGTASDNCIQLRGGVSPASRFTVRGYESELPVSKCFEFGTTNYVHLYQIRVTGSAPTAYSFRRQITIVLANMASSLRSIIMGLGRQAEGEIPSLST